VAKAFTVIPGAAVGLPLAGQPTAEAMFTVGIKVGLGGGSCGWGPMPAASGNCATSPHAVRTIAIAENNNERLGFMTMAPRLRFNAA